MTASNPWFLPLCGFIIVWLVITIITTVRAHKLFKASFYTELYSGFFEYNLRRKSIKRLSTSNWMTNDIGPHKIFFQMAQPNKDEPAQAYMLIILTSGVYTIACKSFEGDYYDKNGKCELKVKEKTNGGERVHTKKVKDPLQELETFNKKWQDYTGRTYKNNNIVVFSDLCTIHMEKPERDKVPFINRVELYQTIKKIHLKSDEIYDEDQINSLYNCFYKKNNVR